jgi:Reverse transcriptase (RNA-dependent DNA polymerase)
VNDPSSFEEAEKKEEWREAMKADINAIENNNTWKLVPLPEDKKTIGVKCVFRTKYNSDNTIQKHKARLVVNGYAQEYGIDYEETFSPVARIESVRLVLALAAQLKATVFQLDVKSAFLNGDLTREVYIDQPPGFEKKGKENQVYRLLKALYGLKQAPRAWYIKIDGFFENCGFSKNMSEPNLFIKDEGTAKFLIVCLYVDDMIYMGTNVKLTN